MKNLSLFFLALLFTLSVKSQEDDGMEAILLTGVEDASKLTNAYINPAMKGLIFGMNNGWYHTAKTHKKLGFDISIGLNAALIPTEDEIFHFADLGLSSSTTSTSLTGATVAGENSLTAPVKVSTVIDGEEVTANFNMPGGVKDDLPINAIPSPNVQLTLGVSNKMDVMVRFVPEVGSDDVKGKLLGLGLKKDITSIFGAIEKLPLHVSILGAFTNMNVNYDIQNDSSIAGSNQEATFKLNSYTIQAIASLNFPVLNIYGGIGYNGGSSELKMKGTYELEYDTGNPAPNDTKTEVITDPLSLKFDANGMRTTLGARLSLGPIKIYGDYTLQEYNTITAGIAISIR
ncbi:DUF6588 family protein [uncultured Lutibacter sp.]|uniref:DUF6588 family protein n=1 Tax=uncultured Lutibacter sp. TaxID=437739 RepID=UPI0026374B2F|nr:DUF6588 family protein [uncultured Lutibacter sp.]